MQDRKQGNQTRQSLGVCPSNRRNIRLTLAFDGTVYHGWQIQNDSQTVQGLLSEAIARITGERVTPTGSGRTDAGTHARGLVANFCTGSRIAPGRMVRALNSLLPRDIRVLSARHAPLDFHARQGRHFKNISIPDVSGPNPAPPSNPRIFPLPTSRRSGENGPCSPSVSRRARFRQFCEDQHVRLQHNPTHLPLRTAETRASPAFDSRGKRFPPSHGP